MAIRGAATGSPFFCREMNMNRFSEVYGFPRSELNLGNWRTRPYNVFSFHNVEEVLPVAMTAGQPGEAEAGTTGEGALDGLRVDISGEKHHWSDFLKLSESDVFLAMKEGRFVCEWNAAHVDPARPHLLFSVTKSVTGMLCGMLEDEGLLDMSAPVSRYLPEAEGAGFGNATLQQLADMRTSLAFDESYLNADGDYARYRRATGWNPPVEGAQAETMTELLLSIGQRDEPHGGPFEYASPNTDMLGVVVERVSGRRFMDLLNERIWKPLGARTKALMTLDSEGAPRGAGGMCATARDMARFGEMVRLGGQINGHRVVSQHWVDDMLTNGDRKAWQNGNFSEFFPDGRYRNCWYLTGYESGAYCCIGIHGQWVYVDPKSEVVIVKLSSQTLPMDEELDLKCLSFFRQVCGAL